MKSICLSIAFFCAASLAAQGPAYQRSLSAYVNLWPLYSSPGNAQSADALGIRQTFRQTPFLMGIDYSHHLHGRWHYFLSAQGSLHYITGLTDIRSPQMLPPSTAAIEGQTNDFAAVQVMIGGGAHYRLLEKKWSFFRLSAGLFGAYTHDRNANAQGIDLFAVDPATSTVVWEPGGAVEHRVFRKFVPVGRLGFGGQYVLRNMPRLGIGADLLYYVSPKFMRGTWDREVPGTNTVATSGSYEAGLNNLMIAVQVSYRF
jgi:hypothetical protein